MTAEGLLILLLGNFALIGLLPAVFFRRGRFNARWLLTAAPFFVAPSLLLLGRDGWLPMLPEAPSGVRAGLDATAAVLSALSVALLVATRAVHRAPIALWHQDDDAPVELVTRGPYARIRHPFYTSFLLAFLAAFLSLPHVSTLACLAYAGIALTLAALREERRLAASPFGAEYRRYLAASGRFLPRLRP